MNNYSQFFHTIHDEQTPVGSIGRGTHYSVLESAQWLSPNLAQHKEPMIHRFAVIWDEDHDTRIIEVLNIAYMRNLMSPIVFVGERKGFLSIVLHPDFERVSNTESHCFLSSWYNIAQYYQDDAWGFEWAFSSTPNEGSIIQGNPEIAKTYLFNISNLWDLGHHRYGDYNPHSVAEELRKERN